MLRLTTLDGVTLLRDGAPVAGVQNRRQSLALLAVLAARGARGATRDELIALFWPDGGVKDPRHSLDQLVSVTRAAAGGVPLLAGTSTLRLDPAGVRTDVDDFEAACGDGRLEAAAALYRAPFAEGVSAGGSAALEQFLDAARSRLAAAHAAAVRTLGERAERRGDHREAARWWRALYEADRLDAAAAARLVGALAAAGQAAEALRAARAAVALVRTELGREAPELVGWVRRLEGAPDGAFDTPPNGVAVGPASSGAARGLPPRALGGRYRAERVLRRGSILTTYLAADGAGEHGHVELHVLEELVASTTRAEHFVEVFARVRALSHPQIVPTLDAGVDGALRWIATGRRPAETLQERLRRERQLPIAEAVAIAADVAGALAHAHERGVVHGDLRPQHGALAGGRADGAGWGVGASVLGGEAAAGESAVLSIGSAVYQSPEQVTGDVRIDARSDVYAFGCVLFEMLAGEPPFGGASRPNRLLKLTQGAPEVREARETVPEGVASVIRGCLARVGADRYAKGGDVLRALAHSAQLVATR